MLSKFTLHSSTAVIIYFVLMSAAYMAVAKFPQLPYLAFSTQLTIGLGVILAKRHFSNKLDADTQQSSVGNDALQKYISAGLLNRNKSPVKVKK